MDSNSWAKWSSVGEILSSIAIVITLLFLAIQTSQNTDAINAQLIANRAESRAAIFQLVANTVEKSVDYPDIAVSLESAEPLSPEAKARLENWLITVFGAREFVWLQYLDGVVDQRTFETIVDTRPLIDQPRVSEWWDQIGSALYDPEFVALINAEFRE